MAERLCRSSPVAGSVQNSRTGQRAETMVLDVGLIEHALDQPRKVFKEEDIASLAETMKAEGQLQPILVRRNPGQPDRWVIVAGERRWRAAKRLGWRQIAAME